MKDKHRFNPFLGVMEHDEAILWLSAQPPVPFMRHAQRLILGWLLVSASYLLPMLLPASRAFPNPLASFALCSAMLFPLCLVFYMIYARHEAKRRATAYMLTNKHIYTSTPQAGVAFYPLERIDELYPADSQTIALDVGAPKPIALKYVKNARAIATLMEQARLDRLDDLYLYKDQMS